MAGRSTTEGGVHGRAGVPGTAPGSTTTNTTTVLPLLPMWHPAVSRTGLECYLMVHNVAFFSIVLAVSAVLSALRLRNTSAH